MVCKFKERIFADYWIFGVKSYLHLSLLLIPYSDNKTLKPVMSPNIAKLYLKIINQVELPWLTIQE